MPAMRHTGARGYRRKRSTGCDKEGRTGAQRMKTKNEKEAFESKERMLEIEMKVDIWKKESG